MKQHLAPAGLLLLLLLVAVAHLPASCQQPAAGELNVIPAVAPYPPTRPFDTGYPGNLPAGLPTALPTPPPILSAGSAGSCSNSVSAVLAQNNRAGLAQYLQQTALGLDILSGRMAATILAPPDAALSRVLAPGDSGPDASTLAAYHVLQGTLRLSDLAARSGRWWNTTLARASCPTAFQTVTMLTGRPDAASDPITFVRSADATARITRGDITACNSVVHLVDGALQPCCVSLYEQLPQFSIVRIQPSYFEGFQPQAPPDNTDGSNRRLFEEALIDFLLFASSANASKTVLWPSPQAWNNVNLAALLPGVPLTEINTRLKAMRILALYAISFQDSILPKDLPLADGSAPSVRWPWATALKNYTTPAVWSCGEAMAVTAPALAAAQSQARLEPTAPATSPVVAATAGPAQAAVPVPSPGVAAPAVTPAPTPVVAPAVTPAPVAAPAVTPVPTTVVAPTVAPTPVVAPAANPTPAVAAPTVTTVPTPVVAPATTPVVAPATLPAPVLLVEANSTPAAADAAADALLKGGARRKAGRRLQAAVTGASKAVGVQGSWETCEGVRVLITDAVLVPCDFGRLLQSYDAIQEQVNTLYENPDRPDSLGAAGLDWLKQQGVDTTGGKNGAGGAGVGVSGRLVQLIGVGLAAAAALVAW